MNCKLNILKTMLAATFCSSVMLSTSGISAELTAPKAFFQQGGQISPQVNFSTPETGDLYIAFRQNGQGSYYFIGKDGSVSTDAKPFESVDNYTGSMNLPTFDSNSVQKGQYQLFSLMVTPGGNINNLQNWIGGFGALKSFNFSVGYGQDNDGDGFRDDDLNRDGFPDRDSDRDGYHDDDHDRDGIADNANNTTTGTTTTNGSLTGTTTTTTSQPTASAQRGETVYNQSCAGCHGTPPSRNGISKGISATASRVAINNNVGGMGFLSTTDAELEDIASYIRGDKTTVSTTSNTATTSTPVATPVPTPAVTTPAVTTPAVTTPVVATTSNDSAGRSTYNQYCASCHGSDPSRNGNNILRASSATASANAIRNNVGGMGYLTNLSTTDLQNIADYVSSSSSTSQSTGTTTSTKTSGQDLYITACSSCHGNPPSRNDIEGGRSAAKTQRAIARNKGGMGYLSYLSYSELQSIANYLQGVNIRGGDDDDDDNWGSNNWNSGWYGEWDD